MKRRKLLLASVALSATAVLSPLGTAVASHAQAPQHTVQSVQQATTVSPPLWWSNYDAYGTGAWFREQEPNWYIKNNNRITTISNAPGSGLNRPLGTTLRVELRPKSATNPGTSSPLDGDVQSTDGINFYNRAELYDRYPTGTASSTPASQWPDPVGSTRWYAVSVYFPTTFVFDSGKWLDFTQWKGFRGGSPPLALEVDDHYVSLGGTRGGGAPGNDMRAITRGQWMKIVIGIHWSTQSSLGWVEAYINDSLEIAHHSMQTMDGTSDSNPDPIYLKQGIYRSSAWAITHTLYFSPMVVARTKTDADAKLNSLVKR